MYFDFSICQSPVPYEGLTLDTIFYINGDRTYSTPKKDITPGKTYFLYTQLGKGVVSYDDQSFTASSNTFIYMQPTKNFSYRSLENKWEFWWFEFFGPSPFPVNQLETLPVDTFTTLLLSKSLQYAKYGDWKLSSALFQTLNLLIVRNVNRASSAIVNEQLVTAIENFIRKNFATVTVRELTEEFGIEERTLRNLLTKTIGIPPKRFILKVRIEHAGNLLLTTSDPLSIIAQKTGFSSQYHFSKVFKEFYGLPPEQYRKYIGLW